MNLALVAMQLVPQQLVPLESTLDLLLRGLSHVTWQGVVMMVVGGILIALAVVKEYEPLLLLPIGAGCLLTNLPLSPLVGEPGGRFNPLIGAAGISAFPMAARVVQKEASRENFENFILMHAMGANAAGQVASCVAGGVLLALMGTA